MTPGARVAAAIELLGLIEKTWKGEDRRPADAILAYYFKGRRYIGSKDRGYVSGLVYQVLRNRLSLEWHIGQSGNSPTPRLWAIAALMTLRHTGTKEITNLFNDARYSTGKINEKESRFIHYITERNPENLTKGMPEHVRYNIPEALLPQLRESIESALKSRGVSSPDVGAELETLNTEAPVDLRVNMLKAKSRDEVIKKLKAEGFEPEPTAISPVGIRLAKRAAIFASPSFKEGLFEVQDEGSQIVSLLADAKPGMRVIDFCAGAGGKTLVLAAQMKNRGKILALDTSEKRLSQTKLRLRRAGAGNVELHAIENETDKFLKRHAESADLVLVDAPCSGTGTWRRNPDLKWRTTPDDIEELTALQSRILQSASKLVKKGGRLVYATCSLLDAENNQRVEKFIVDNSTFRVVATGEIWNTLFPDAPPHNEETLQLIPHQDGTDGFFAAVFEKAN